MGIPERIIWWVVAAVALVFGIAFLIGAGRAFGIIDATPRPAPAHVPQAAPTPSYVPPSGSRCSPSIEGAPYDWSAVVCPVADRLTAARADLDEIVRDSDDQDWIGAYADAALLSQQLDQLELTAEHAPAWKKGASILADVRGAIDSYRDGVAQLNRAAQAHDKKAVPAGKKLIAAGNKSFASAVHGLRALASPNPSTAATPAGSAAPVSTTAASPTAHPTTRPSAAP